ncbi:uncharacterized protein Dwil_GK27856, partial [Drosophila willistoni]
TTTTANSSSSNPVRTANQRYFLISSFKDPTFLKAECELAHSQVQQQQHQVVVGNNITKTVKLSKRFKSTLNTNEDTKNNNYNNLNDMRIKSNGDDDDDDD